MIFHKSPGIDAQGISSTKIGQAFKKIFPIVFVVKYLYSVNASLNYIVKSFWNQRFTGNKTSL
jgi:hypothetical protein